MSEKVCKLIGGGMKEAINLIYPVGRTIICDHSPQTDYPWQTWKQDFKDVFPLGAGDTYAAGATGGEYSHTLKISEIPSHDHAVVPLGAKGGTNGNYRANDQYSAMSGADTLNLSDGNMFYARATSKEGGGQAHNNMPPYKAVKYWTRTA